MATTVNVLCYKSKTLSNGEHPLMIRICKDGKKKYVSLGVSVRAEHWNFEKSVPKSNCPDREHINILIANWKIQCKLPPKTKRFCPLVLK